MCVVHVYVCVGGIPVDLNPETPNQDSKSSHFGKKLEFHELAHNFVIGRHDIWQTILFFQD